MAVPHVFKNILDEMSSDLQASVVTDVLIGLGKMLGIERLSLACGALYSLFPPQSMWDGYLAAVADRPSPVDGDEIIKFYQNHPTFVNAIADLTNLLLYLPFDK